MFLCSKCVAELHFFAIHPSSRGLCEMCGIEAMCVDMPAHSLPYPLPKQEEKVEAFQCDRCTTTIQGIPSKDGPQVQGLRNGQYDDLCDSCRESLNKWRRGEAIPEIERPESAVEWFDSGGGIVHRSTDMTLRSAVETRDALKSAGLTAWLMSASKQENK